MNLGINKNFTKTMVSEVNMKYGKIYFIIFFSFIFCFQLFPEKSKITLYSLDHPRVITIKSNFQSIEDMVKISYKYYGNEIISNYGKYGDYMFGFFYDLEGKRIYYDISGKILNQTDIGDEKNLDGIGGGLFGNGIGVLFKNNEIYSFDFHILPSTIDSENSYLNKLIKKKALSYIVICIGKVILDWEESEMNKKSKKRRQPFRKGKLVLNVNKTLRIDIKYDDIVDNKK